MSDAPTRRAALAAITAAAVLPASRASASDLGSTAFRDAVHAYQRARAAYDAECAKYVEEEEPPIPEALFITDFDITSCLPNSYPFGHATAPDGRRYWHERGVESLRPGWVSSKSVVESDEITFAVRIVKQQPSAEELARAEEICAAFDAWNAIHGPIQARWQAAEERESDLLGIADDLAREAVLLPVRTPAELVRKLEIIRNEGLAFGAPEHVSAMLDAIERDVKAIADADDV